MLFSAQAPFYAPQRFCTPKIVCRALPQRPENCSSRSIATSLAKDDTGPKFSMIPLTHLLHMLSTHCSHAAEPWTHPKQHDPPLNFCSICDPRHLSLAPHQYPRTVHLERHRCQQRLLQPRKLHRKRCPSDSTATPFIFTGAAPYLSPMADHSSLGFYRQFDDTHLHRRVPASAVFP